MGQPKAAHDHGRGAAEGQHTAIDFGVRGGPAGSEQAHEPGEGGHGHNRAERKRRQIRQRLQTRRKSQHQEDTKKMRAASQAVQQADAECGVGVLVMGLGLLMRNAG